MVIVYDVIHIVMSSIIPYFRKFSFVKIVNFVTWGAWLIGHIKSKNYNVNLFN